MNESTEAEKLDVDQIRSQMRQYRREFDSDVDDFVASTESLTDWKQYVTSQPLLSFAVCACAGYLLIPKKKQYITPDPQKIAELVKREKLVVARPQSVKRSSGLMSGAMKAATRIALQTASGIAMQKLGAAMEAASDDGDSA